MFLLPIVANRTCAFLHHTSAWWRRAGGGAAVDANVGQLHGTVKQQPDRAESEHMCSSHAVHYACQATSTSSTCRALEFYSLGLGLGQLQGNALQCKHCKSPRRACAPKKSSVEDPVGCFASSSAVDPAAPVIPPSNLKEIRSRYASCSRR